MSLNNSNVSGSSISVPRKIPGPASKTLGRIQPAGGGVERGGVEQGEARVSSVSLAELKRSISTENNMALPQSQRSSLNQSQMQVAPKSTCLLCSDPVLLPVEDATAAKERNEVIKTLCFHMQMMPKEVPRNCTAEMFPFCKVCENLVKQLWESEKIIQEAQKKISKNISVIERTVADAELLRATTRISPSMASGEEKKFVKLRDTILDGYRTKLVIRQKLRENLILGNELAIKQPVYSHTAIMDDKSLRSQFHANRTAAVPHPLPPVASTSVQTSDTHENITVNVSPVDVGLNTSFSSSSEENEQEQGEPDAVGTGNNTSIENSRLPTPQPQPLPPVQPLPQAPVAPQPPQINSQPVQLQQNVRRPGRPARPKPLATASTSVPAGRGMVGMYNENSCTMVISNVRSGSASPSRGTPTPVVIKQEPQDTDTLSPTPVLAGKRKRRTLFQGIEIAKLTDTRTNRRHFQCTICKFTIPSTISATGLSPYQTMAQHITERHLSKKRRTALANHRGSASSAANAAPILLPKPRQFTCKVCSKVFANLKALLDHKSSHIPVKIAPATPQAGTSKTRRRRSTANKYYIDNLECDVCGRPVKGNLTNLMAHKFSHKNNEERQAALAARERGSRNALLRSDQAKRAVGRPRKHPPKPLILTVKTKRYRRGKAKSFGSTSSAVAARLRKEIDAGPYKCQVCSRDFKRSCSLALHMLGHARRNKTPIPLSKAKQRIAMRQPIPKQKEDEDELLEKPEDYSTSREEDEFTDQVASQQDESPSNEDLSGQVSNEDETMEYEDGANSSSFELRQGPANESVDGINANATI